MRIGVQIGRESLIILSADTQLIDLQRTIRYQGAIIQDDCVLLIRYRDPQSERTFWMVPGGGREPHESEEECVQREMHE